MATRGTTLAHSHGVYTATGEVTAPILQIAKTRGDEQVAGAQFTQAEARLSDQVQQVNEDIRASILDIEARRSWLRQRSRMSIWPPKP